MDTLLDVGLGNAVIVCVLAPAAVVLGWILRRRPAVVHALWVLVLLKLVTPSLVQVAPPWTVADKSNLTSSETGLIATVDQTLAVDAADLRTPVVTEPPDPAAVARPVPLRELLIGAWLAGAVSFWGVAAWRVVRFRRLLRAATPAPADVREQAARVADRLGMRSVPTICLVPARVSPLVWALGPAPRLVLPIELWDDLTSDQQDAVLAHELAHLRRGDPWVRRLELLTGGLYWWHPVVWWARREIEKAEEQCCDAWVAWALPGVRPAYADALVATVGFLSGPRPALPAGASGVGGVRPLKRRLTMILNGTTTSAAARALPRGMLAVGAIALLWLPTWARDDPPATKTPDPPKSERKIDPTDRAKGKATDDAAGNDEDKAAPKAVTRKAGKGLEATGTVQVMRTATLTPAASGRVVTVGVDVGATVKQGQVLAELDSQRAKLELMRAEAKLHAAKSRYESTRNARAAIGGSESELRAAEAELRVAEADVGLARLAVEGARITAPIEGTVLSWTANPGQTVEAGRSLGEVADLKRVMAVVDLPPKEVSRLTVGGPCRIRVADVETSYPGVVGRIDPVVSPRTGTIKVYVVIKPPGDRESPRPGSFAIVEFAGIE